MAVGISSLEGLAAQFIWPDSPRLTNLALPVGMAMSGLLAAQFVRAFLNTKRNRPRTDRVLKLFIAWYAVAILLNLVSYQWAEMMTSLAAMCFSATTLIVGIVSYRRGYPGARYFLLAWSCLLAGSIMLAVRNFGWMPTNFITRYGFQIGSGLEMLLLSYALADRITTLRRDKEIADAKLLQMQEENVAALQQSERELEQRVAERTRELAAANAQLEVLSRHDALTGLGNRNELEQAWNRMESYASRSGRGVAVLLMDLNRFKPINDAHGHHVGDQVLREVAARLNENTRVTDTVVRLGGDEFVMLIGDIDTEAQIEPIRSKIDEVIGDPIPVHGCTLEVGCSIGVAFYPTDGKTLADLLEKADSAMYRSKRLESCR
jgi:diguanylate cyclase (GGDEF)-like protein